MNSAKKPQPTNWLNPPAAKPHPLLQDLEAQMRGAQVEDTFLICGHKYTMRTLWPHEESWADAYVAGQNFYQTGRNRRAPYIAASLVAIDGHATAVLFQLPSDTPSEMLEEYSTNQELLDAWRRDQLYQRISGSTPLIPPPVLAQLWTHYQELEGRRTESLEKIGPLSSRTGSGESSPTSSPAKAS